MRWASQALHLELAHGQQVDLLRFGHAANSFPQASVALGEPGVSLKDPDAYALEVLGGMYNGFGGSLFNEVCVGTHSKRLTFQ